VTLATTCPHCRTSFRVVADQLKLRRGRVRCGRCQRVFSGVDHLVDLDELDLAEAAASLPPPPSQSEEAPTTPLSALSGEAKDAGARGTGAQGTGAQGGGAQDATAHGGAAQDGAAQDDLTGGGVAKGPSATSVPRSESASLDAPVGEPAIWPVATPMMERIGADSPIAGGISDVEGGLFEPPLPVPPRAEARPSGGTLSDDRSSVTTDPAPPQPEAEIPSSALPGDRPPALPLAGLAPALPLAGLAPELERTGELPYEPSSDRPSEAAARGKNRWMKSLIVLGLAGLILQGALGWRHELAYRHPQLYPWIVQAAQAVGLGVHPPLDADALTIESFEVRPTEQPDQLRVEAVLRNRSERPVAFPAIELTLRDSQSVMLVRRVIPSEAWASEALRARGIAAGSEWPVQLVLEHDGLAVAGYAAVLFHP
jgi:predicted Zn finger-like uncharacterized protein